MKIKEIAMYILGGLVAIGFFAIVILLVISGKNEGTLNLLIGALIGAFTSVIHYFFGSSSGSAEKNALLIEKKQNEN
jgi:hypothetical protein